MPDWVLMTFTVTIALRFEGAEDRGVVRFGAPGSEDHFAITTAEELRDGFSREIDALARGLAGPMRT